MVPPIQALTGLPCLGSFSVLYSLANAVHLEGIPGSCWGWTLVVSQLGKLVSVFWWVELDFFSLEYNEVSISEFWRVYGFGVALNSLSFNA